MNSGQIFLHPPTHGRVGGVCVLEWTGPPQASEKGREAIVKAQSKKGKRLGCSWGCVSSGHWHCMASGEPLGVALKDQNKTERSERGRTAWVRDGGGGGGGGRLRLRTDSGRREAGPSHSQGKTLRNRVLWFLSCEYPCDHCHYVGESQGLGSSPHAPS